MTNHGITTDTRVNAKDITASVWETCSLTFALTMDNGDDARRQRYRHQHKGCTCGDGGSQAHSLHQALIHTDVVMKAEQVVDWDQLSKGVPYGEIRLVSGMISVVLPGNVEPIETIQTGRNDVQQQDAAWRYVVVQSLPGSISSRLGFPENRLTETGPARAAEILVVENTGAAAAAVTHGLGVPPGSRLIKVSSAGAAMGL